MVPIRVPVDAGLAELLLRVLQARISMLEQVVDGFVLLGRAELKHPVLQLLHSLQSRYKVSSAMGFSENVASGVPGQGVLRGSLSPCRSGTMGPGDRSHCSRD